MLKKAEEHKILFANGPPGTGKTFVVHREIRKWHEAGARISFLLPTGQLSLEMRVQRPDVDTYNGGLLLFKELSEALGIMTQYDLIVLDEVSMLIDEHFDKVLAMWQAADKMPCPLLLGDFWQLPIVNPEKRRCAHSPLWRGNVRVIEQVRCKDRKLQEKLDILRTAVPSVSQLNKIKKNHCAWTTEEPTDWNILSLLCKHPDTTIVTCTRAATALVNALATQVLFVNRHKRPLGNIPLDYERNEDNYTAKGNLKKGPA